MSTHTVVSVTPLPVEADSRTYREAASFARFGHRSIVVEGQRSNALPADLPFELSDAATASDPAGAETADTASPDPARRSWLRSVARPLLRHPAAIGRFLGDYAARMRALAAALPAADVYVVHSPVQAPAVLSAARRHGAGVIYDAHDLYSVLVAERSDATFDERSVGRIYNLVERRCVRRAAARLTVGPRLAELQRQRFHRPFDIVRNLHDPRLDHESARSVREAAGAGDDDLLAVLIGNAKPSMPIAQVLEAMTRTPPHVRLAGVGRRYEQFAPLVRELGLESRVAFVGAVAPTMVRSFLRDADLALSLYIAPRPSGRVALPNGFFQAIAAELPVVYPTATELPDLADLAARYDVGTAVRADDPTAIATALAELASNPGRLEELRERSRAAAAELTWEGEEVVLRRGLEAALAQKERRP